MISNPRPAVDDLDDTGGESSRHILLGLALVGGAIAASALIARLSAPPKDVPEIYTDYEDPNPPTPQPPPSIFSIIWPPLFFAVTLSGFRIWAAPAGGARSQALALWGLVQILNASWMALGPRRLSGQLGAATLSLGATIAYAWRARHVDAGAARMVAPYLGWLAFANLLGEELWRKTMKPTLTDLPAARLFKRRAERPPTWTLD